MQISEFDFHLPEDRIALRPAEPREAARLLCVAPDQPFIDATVADLPDLLLAGDCIVVNNTRVIPAEFVAQRQREAGTARITLTLHQRTDSSTWQAFARPAKKVRAGETLTFLPWVSHDAEQQSPDAHHPGTHSLAATVMHKNGGELTLEFSCSGADLDAAIAHYGRMPLPPYISSKRSIDAADETDYQTTFATRDGAVAAPTAGLHFTPELLQRLERHGIKQATLTLHVGAGTFLPVKVDDTRDHKMHGEWGEISELAAETINATRASGGRIVAVGTTCVRLLETAALPEGRVEPWRGTTDIFLAPGYRFRAVDVMLTNLHLPKSTLFMLVSAFAGLDRMKAAYAHAIAEHYRFYSFGDACLLTHNPDVAQTFADERG